MKQTDDSLAIQKKDGGFLDAYRQTLPTVIRHPATWLLSSLWLIATIYLLIIGFVKLPFLLESIASIVALLLLIPMTQGALPAPWEEPAERAAISRSRLWLQVGLTTLSVFLIVLVRLFGILRISLPLFTAYYKLMSASMLITILSILIFEIFIPLGLVLLLGAQRRELGFQQGYHIWRVTVLWSIVPIILYIIGIAEGKITLLTILTRCILLLLIAAIPEEIAIRSILMTRLIRLLGTGWGIAISALIFGLLHFGTDIVQAGSTSAIVVLALTLFGQMSGGVFLAVTVQRTRSLIPGIIAHTLGDASAGLI